MAKTNKPLSSQLKNTGFLAELWQQARLVYYLIRDRDVPLYLKALPLLAIVYTLFPLDIVADLVPVLGQLDDLMILTIGAKIFIEMAPAEVVARYMEQMRSGSAATVIEGTASDVAEAVGEAKTEAQVKIDESELANEVATGLKDVINKVRRRP